MLQSYLSLSNSQPFQTKMLQSGWVRVFNFSIHELFRSKAFFFFFYRFTECIIFTYGIWTLHNTTAEIYAVEIAYTEKWIGRKFRRFVRILKKPYQVLWRQKVYRQRVKIQTKCRLKLNLEKQITRKVLQASLVLICYQINIFSVLIEKLYYLFQLIFYNFLENVLKYVS